jgi:hypothetical protein
LKITEQHKPSDSGTLVDGRAAKTEQNDDAACRFGDLLRWTGWLQLSCHNSYFSVFTDYPICLRTEATLFRTVLRNSALGLLIVK